MLFRFALLSFDGKTQEAVALFYDNEEPSWCSPSIIFLQPCIPECPISFAETIKNMDLRNRDHGYNAFMALNSRYEAGHGDRVVEFEHKGNVVNRPISWVIRRG